MNPEATQLLRQAVLLQLDAARPASLAVATLLHGLRLAGHTISDEALRAELAYLADKGWVRETRTPLSQALVRFQLTASGRDLLESLGLA